MLRVTGSRLGALAGAVLFALDADVLYLQSTPMTEPLLFGLTLLAAALVYEWVDGGAVSPPRAAGWTLALACLTRYEAWPVAAGLVGLAALALHVRGSRLRTAAWAAARLAIYPAAAVVGFLIHSRYTIGHWFVTGGFFVPDARTLHRPLRPPSR